MTSRIHSHARASAARLALFLGATLAGASAHAALTVSTTEGAALSGAHYVNFDDFDYNIGTSGGVTVSLTPNSGPYNGAQPYITNSNGVPFGDATVSGPDPTLYLFAGTPITLGLPGAQTYFGILWGSVDASNSLSFYAADGTLVGVVHGSDVAPTANGSWDADGTVYVNIESSVAFTTVVADGGQSIFEFDNVAYNPIIPTASSVPEPAQAALLLAGLMAAPLLARKRRAR